MGQKSSKPRTSGLLSEQWKSPKSTAKHHPRFTPSTRDPSLKTDYRKRETKMASAKTISMNEVHRQASFKITLCAQQSQGPSSNGLRSSRPFQACSTSPQLNIKLPTTQAVYAWLDDCSTTQAFWEGPENQDQPAVRSSCFPSTHDGSRNSAQPVSIDQPLRPTLEQRFAALRRALNPSSPSGPSGRSSPSSQSIYSSAADSPTNHKPERPPDVDAAQEEEEQIVVRPRPTSRLPTSDVPARGLRTLIASNAYLTERSNSANPSDLMTDTEADVVDFVVRDPDLRPIANLCWSSVAPSGSIFGGKLLKGHIRIHVAAKLNVDARSFALWYDKWPSTEPSITDDEIPTPCRVTVNIMPDPYIRLIFREESHTLDCSHHYFHKVNIPVGLIRKEVRAKLDVAHDQEVILYLQEKELVDDRIPLRDSGLLSVNICHGLEPLYLRAETKTRYKTCIVCGDELSIHEFKSRRFTSACTHEVNTCNTCLGHWLDESLNSRGFDKISCPECNSPFRHADLKLCATARQFNRYDQLATRAALSLIPDFHWCLSPQCRSGQIHASHNPIFACSACGFKQCVRHEEPWHEGETCQEYNYRKSGRKKRDEEEQTQRTIARTTKQCPGKRCGANIEKNSGCDHMTCRKCKHEFCWICMAAYEPIRRIGNSMHARTCVHFAVWNAS